MNKIIPSILILSFVVIGLSPVYADQVSDLLAKITTLEKKIADKDAILMEQVKVIMFIKDNYKANYPDFDKVKYAKTGGFSTEWLQGERVKIIETCKEAQSMGYENPYCKYVS